MSQNSINTKIETQSVDITLLVCTYNRAADLRELLESALAQGTGSEVKYEVLVVDNNSTDDTRVVVESFINKGHENLRYIFEARQGKSHALNAGIAAVRGWAYVITDDDFILPPDWVKNIYEAFCTNPDVSFVSGKVLPLWQGEQPSWLTREHWSAIAMADYGQESFIADDNNQICLLACAFRLADVQAVGGYHDDLGPQKNRTGATEDLELLLRLWKSGRKGLYVPHISFKHKVTADRLTKDYHRRWHRDHGRSYAVMRTEETERSSMRLFDVPGHMYRAAVVNALRWLGCMLRGKLDEAFLYETQLRFFGGFLSKRRADMKADVSSDGGSAFHAG
jgi:glycosyltransferase involved in cell wall biosynthesis